MSVTGEKLPPERTILTAIDKQARVSAQRAQRELAPIVARETPRGRTGKTAAAMRPRVSRTSTGVALTIAAPRGKAHSGRATIADVVRWVTRGTGLYRSTPGPKAPIRAKGGVLGNLLARKPMTLPGGKKVWSVKGQRPNPFVDRIRHIGTPRVERIFVEGASEAARAVERVLD